MMCSGSRFHSTSAAVCNRSIAAGLTGCVMKTRGRARWVSSTLACCTVGLRAHVEGREVTDGNVGFLLFVNGAAAGLIWQPVARCRGVHPMHDTRDAIDSDH